VQTDWKEYEFMGSRDHAFKASNDPLIYLFFPHLKTSKLAT